VTTTKAKWTIADKKKFESLVADLKELVDALSNISSSLQLLPRQNELISIEVASLSDKPSLELLEVALEGW
jgi:hypothetical protein